MIGGSGSFQTSSFYSQNEVILFLLATQSGFCSQKPCNNNTVRAQEIPFTSQWHEEEEREAHNACKNINTRNYLICASIQTDYIGSWPQFLV